MLDLEDLYICIHGIRGDIAYRPLPTAPVPGIAYARDRTRGPWGMFTTNIWLILIGSADTGSFL